ncbi:transposase [Allochromatium tepidum]|uniref:transposase n=1 Tax=Allochromatium tepidum TaxID=553982 RepID=UPI001EFFCE06|nr:transposase [Allochromatium tepidum]
MRLLLAGQDRAGLERLLRYCARPPFALERLEQINPHQLVYYLPKPRRDGRTTLVLSPLELIDAPAGLIPPPRRHRHRYHGVLAPNSPLRAAVTAYGREEAPSPQAPAKTVSATDEEPASASPARYLWAMLPARLFESLPLVCPCCGANMRIVAFITEAAPVKQILTHIGEPPRPPPISPARGPPAWDEAPEPAPDWNLAAQPEPEVEFDQRVTW